MLTAWYTIPMQTIALSLLIAVQTLLIQAQKMPNISPELRSQIDNVAQVALSVATQALNEPVPVLTAPAPKPVDTRPDYIRMLEQNPGYWVDTDPNRNQGEYPSCITNGKDVLCAS